MTSDKPKTKELKKKLGYILPLILTGIFLFFSFRNVDLGESLNIITDVAPLWIFVYLIVFYLSHLIRAVRWKVIISSVKPDASVLNLFGTVMIGYGINCAVPRLGEIYRAMFLGKWENLSRTSLLGTIIVERVIDIFSFVTAVLVSVMVFPGNLLKEFTWLESTIYFGFGMILLVIVFLIIVVRKREKFYSGIIKIVDKFSSRWTEKLVYIFEMLANGFSSLQGVKNYFYSLFLTVLMLLLYAVTNYVGFFMMRMDAIQPVTFGMAWILMTISALGVAVPTPGGTGSYHAFVIIVLVNLFNFSTETSAAYALFTHFITYVVFITSTFILIYCINKRRVKKGEPSENLLSVFKNKPVDE
ncbi:lysylphosphatidylglycerol synthase transmembrane domain-containing protein [Bacteroidota bacterium]